MVKSDFLMPEDKDQDGSIDIDLNDPLAMGKNEPSASSSKSQVEKDPIQVVTPVDKKGQNLEEPEIQDPEKDETFDRKIKKKKFECPDCSKTFTTKYTMNRHRESSCPGIRGSQKSKKRRFLESDSDEEEKSNQSVETIESGESGSKKIMEPTPKGPLMKIPVAFRKRQTAKDSEGNDYEVFRVIGHRWDADGKLLVKCLGEWEARSPEDTACDELIVDYFQRSGLAVPQQFIK